MVVCPWCGTNYASFQSNCSNCGGPIRSTDRVIPEVERGEVEMPPPPPREVSDKYHWRLMTRDAWAQAAVVFALLGAIFTVVGLVLTLAIITAFVGLPFLGMGLAFFGGGGYVLYWRYQEAMKSVNILANGEATVGWITDAQVNYSVRVNGVNPLTILYKYRVNGTEYEGKLTTLNRMGLDYQPGRNVCVLYLSNALDYSSLYPHP